MTFPIVAVAVVLGVLVGASVGLATEAIWGRWWLSVVVAGLWAATVTWVLGAPW